MDTNNQHQHQHQSVYQPPMQYYQPQPIYQPHQYMQAPPRLVPYNKGWHVTKIVFGSLAIVFDAVVIGVSASISLLPDLTGGWLVAVIACPPAAISMIWIIAELITICARGGKLGIHPGAHVGLHLILWLGFGVVVGLLAALQAFDSCGSSCRRYYRDEYETMYNSRGAVIGFSVLLLIIHFTLFVGACVDTQKRNSTRPVVMVSAEGSRAVYAPPPMPPMSQPQPGYNGGVPIPPAAYMPSPQNGSQRHLSMYSATQGSSHPAELTSSSSPAPAPQELKAQPTGTTVNYTHSSPGTDVASPEITQYR